MAKNPNEILTVSGIYMDPFAPLPEQICIKDVAHALSLLTRANGHIRRFYSVAQHCLNCELEAAARGYDADTRLFCLLHDASECYLSDLTRPVKRRFPLYYEAEQRLQQIIFSALTGKAPTQAQWERVGEVDDCLLYHEFLQLRGTAVFDEAPALCAECDFSQCGIEDVRREFLARYHSLSGR